MRSSIGNHLQMTIYGESHGVECGVILSGIPAGILIDYTLINYQMYLRKPAGKISTSRVEKDEVIIKSGIFNGYTTGAPLIITIANKQQHSQDYQASKYIARPSHADYSAFKKYRGFNDYRGGGHFSGRLTAPLVAAGAICKQLLNSKGIIVASHLKKIGEICDKEFNVANLIWEQEYLNKQKFAVLDEKIKKQMQQLIETVATNNDSIGGVIETVVTGLPAGVGEPYFDSIESMLSHAIFSIGGVKGIEFGSGFSLSEQLGSLANDECYYQDNEVHYQTNHSGGINGGISNGNYLLFKTAIKPTPSIGLSQTTIDFKNKQTIDYTINGRHDPCIVHRARVVVDSMCAFVLCDLLLMQFKDEYFCGDQR